MTEDKPDRAGTLERIASVLGAGFGFGFGFGATVDAQMGDPVTGAMAGETLAQVAGDFADRVLSPRREQRISPVLDFAGSLITDGIASGRTLRDDGFFEAPHLDATEVFEGVLLISRDEHEQRKLPYIAHLMAQISFDENLTVSTANFLIVEAERLTWLQMQLLAIVSRSEEFPLPDVHMGAFGSTWGNWTVSHTFHRMVAPEGAFFQASQQADDSTGFPGHDLSLRRLQLTSQGALMASALGLNAVPQEELQVSYDTFVEVARLRHEQCGHT
ncbi:hypothetical protein [uncultured Microbacterium sp.]|uniref:hypothetical protein n=1 Tax=uncultured Microbacterium sp. TaxID=191216 RepID=UPI0028E5FF3F|nr:hypothetical protein [uncultured Microbacterium sp.]